MGKQNLQQSDQAPLYQWPHSAPCDLGLAQYSTPLAWHSSTAPGDQGKGVVLGSPEAGATPGRHEKRQEIDEVGFLY
jgi:hypothetical protein